MSENQVLALKNGFEVLLGTEKLKVAEKERYIVLIQENYRNVIEAVLNEEFEQILDLSTLSKYIFKAGHQEVRENEAKVEKNRLRIKNRLYDLSIEHLRVCSEKEIDNNTVPWVVYILQLLKKSYILANIHMENEITSCLYSCAVNSQLHWIQHGLLKELWTIIWQRVRSSSVDPSILGNLVKTAIRILENVKLEVLDLDSYTFSKMALGALKQATNGQTSRSFWTPTRKSAYVQILAHLVKYHSLAALDLLLFEIREICGADNFISMLTVFETCPPTDCRLQTLQFFDSFFKCFMLLPAGKMVQNADKVRKMAAECAAIMLTSAESSMTTRSRFDPAECCVKFLARVLVAGNCCEEVQTLQKSCIQRSFSIRILAEILEHYDILTDAENTLKSLWINRKSFSSDSQRVAFCQFLTVYFKTRKNFGVDSVSISAVLKYALSLITNANTLSSSAILVETILNYSNPSRDIPREMLPRMMDTLMTRGQPDSRPIQRVISTFLARVDFEENWKVANSLEEEDDDEAQGVRKMWRFRKSIIDWLLTAPNATTAILIRQITEYEPKPCTFEISPKIDDPLQTIIEQLKLLKIPKPPENINKYGGYIENIVEYVAKSLKTLSDSANLLKLQILEVAPNTDVLIRSMSEMEFLECCQHFESWPAEMKIPENLKTPPILAWFCFLNLENAAGGWVREIDGNISAVLAEILSRLPLEGFRKSEIFAKFVSDFIFENREDIYETTMRFEKFGELLNEKSLMEVKVKIWRLTNEFLKSAASIEESDAFLIQTILTNTYLQFSKNSKLSGNHDLDPFFVARFPQNVEFDRRNCLKYLKALRNSPYYAQNIVRNVLENEKIYRGFVVPVLEFVLKNEQLLMVCLTKIENFRRFLRIYEVNFDSSVLQNVFLPFPLVQIDRCQKYLKFPKKFGAFIQPRDFRLILMGTTRFGRICYRFWRLFDEHPGEICEVLVEFASECVKLGLTDRLQTILKSLKTSEFSVPILKDPKSRQVFTFICRAVQQIIGVSRSENEEDEEVGFSVENLLKTGIETLDFTHFGNEDFYWNLSEELSEEVLEICEENGVHIFDILSVAWRCLPEMRPHILPIVARFAHIYPNFPQPARSFRREAFDIELRFKLALRIMSGSAKMLQNEMATMIMMYLGVHEKARIDLNPRDEGFGQLCWDLGRRVGMRNEVKTMASIAQGFPEIAMMVLPNVLNLYMVENANGHKFAISKFLSLLKFVDAKNRDHVECLCECLDAIGMSKFAKFEHCEENETGIEVDKFFELANLFVKHAFLDHAFGVANLLFDRLSFKIRNIMMISRLSLSDLPTNSQQLIDLLKRIYIAENNSVALSTLPSNIHNCGEIQRVSLRKSKEWLELFSAIDSETKESTICQWMCGMPRPDAKNDEQVYLDAILRCDFDENYPKIIDSTEKLIYKILYDSKNPEDDEDLMKNVKIEDYRLIQVAKGEFEPLNELEHVIYAIRKVRDDSRDDEKCREILKVAKLLAKTKAFKAALMILDKWIEKCRENKHLIDESLVEICRCEILFNSGKHQMAETCLLPIKPKSVESIAEHGLVQSQILIEYRNDIEEAMRILERTVSRIPDDHPDQKLKVLLRFHDVCMDQLTKLEKYKEGLIYRIKTKAIEEFQTQIDMRSLDVTRRSSARDENNSEENRRTVYRLRREQQCEKEHIDHIEANVVAAARKAVASGLAALETIARQRDVATNSTTPLLIFPLIDVIYKYEQLDEIVAVLKEHTTMRRVASRLWICATSHIASKCFARQQSPLKKYLRMILSQLVLDYPYHVLHTLLIYEHESNGAEIKRFIDSIGGEKRKLREIIFEMRRAHDAYRQFARLDVKNNENVRMAKVDGKTVYKLPKNMLLNMCELSKLPIPCISQPIGEPGDYSDAHIITWQSWKDHFILADGLSTPKIWQIRGSDGQWYKTVWKKEDVRQDLLVEQMFDVTNCILKSEKSMARAKNSLRTYKIVPLDQGCGIIEFCHGTVSMKELLCGTNKSGGLHTRLRPNEPTMSNITMRMREVQTDTTEKRRNVFSDICRQVSPVFRHHFYGEGDYDDAEHDGCRVWRQKLAQYRQSLATWSMVGYIVGLGDRHTSNILFDTQQCHFVHIDFGMILEYSKRLLPVPELVPFRLSRDLLDPILIEGIENGQLADECTNVIEKLKKNQKVLLGVASALLRETMSNFREVEQDASRPSYISQMAIDRLREKLATTSGVAANLEVRRMLRDATNADNLSRMFCGWMPFL